MGGSDAASCYQSRGAGKAYVVLGIRDQQAYHLKLAPPATSQAIHSSMSTYEQLFIICETSFLLLPLAHRLAVAELTIHHGESGPARCLRAGQPKSNYRYCRGLHEKR